MLDSGDLLLQLRLAFARLIFDIKEMKQWVELSFKVHFLPSRCLEIISASNPQNLPSSAGFKRITPHGLAHNARFYYVG
jgi:hypothetical protein